MASKDSKNLALAMWVCTIFLHFIPGLLGYLLKADDKYVKSQSTEALNWAITAFLAYAAASIISAIGLGSIGGLLTSAVGIIHLIFCILGAVAVSKGDNYEVPFALRLIK